MADEPLTPEEPDDYFEYTGGYNVGQWGYQVLTERRRKMPPKNPIGFALPLEEESCGASLPDEQSTLTNPIEDSKNS